MELEKRKWGTQQSPYTLSFRVNLRNYHRVRDTAFSAGLAPSDLMRLLIEPPVVAWALAWREKEAGE